MRSPVIFAVIAIGLCAGAFLAPPAPFIIDGGIYFDMARAMADDGALHIGENGGVPGAPPLTKHLTVAHDGMVYPQYPSGYALLAAPFYKILDVRGLMLMNALGFAASICLTFAIARRLFDAQIAKWAAVIFAIATFAPAYAFSIWPHLASLALTLGAVYCAAAARDAKTANACFLFLGCAGLLIGAGINIRIDIAVTALVIFFWLRLFARPHDRLGPVALLLGLTPGLLLSAWLNDLKFGAFTPFSYGPADGNASVGRYAPVIALTFAATAGAWLFNLHSLANWAWKQNRRGIILIAFLFLAALLAIVPVRDLLWRVITGAYVLVFNLQAHDAYYQAGVERNEFGHLLFWGYPKKALIQSLPWAPLIILPVFFFFRGKHVRAVSLCSLAIAAPIAFYALNQWHGGGSYSMRYFMPALPFIAILSAWGLRSLTTKAGPNRQAVLMALVAAGVLYLGLQEIGQLSDRFLTPAALYPQWLIAAAVFTAACFTLTRPFGEQPRVIASGIALFALAYGVVINLYEEAGLERTRAEQFALAEDASAPIGQGALVVTATPLSFIPAERRGAHVMAAQEKTVAETAQAVRAFADAGRCVYIHNSYARDMIAAGLGRTVDPVPLWALSARFDKDPRLAFFVLADAPENCRFH